MGSGLKFKLDAASARFFVIGIGSRKERPRQDEVRIVKNFIVGVNLEQGGANGQTFIKLVLNAGLIMYADLRGQNLFE